MTLEQAFWTFGIKDRNISEAELKTIYKKTLKLVHPDATTDDIQDIAEEKTRELIEAYDMIRKYRESQNWSTSESSAETYGQSGATRRKDGFAGNKDPRESAERARQAEERARREAEERARREAEERARQAKEAERNRDHSRDTFTPQQAFEKIKNTKLLAQTVFFTLCSFAVLLSVYEWLVSDDKIDYIIRNCTTYLALLSFYLVVAIIVWLWKRIVFDWGCIGVALKVLLAALAFDWLTFLAEKLIINLGVIGMAAMVLIQLFFDRNTVKRAIRYRKDNPYPPEKKIAGIYLSVYGFAMAAAVIWIVLRILVGLFR